MMKEKEQEHISFPTIEQFYLLRKQSFQQINNFEKKLDEITTNQPEIIKLAVKEHVNGKIDNLSVIAKNNEEMINELTKTVTDYIQTDMERNKLKDEQYELDKKWKEEFGPYVKGVANLTIGGKIIVVIALGISAIIGAVFAVKQLFIK